MKLHYLGTGAAEGWPAVFCGCEACRRARALGGKNIRTRAQMLIDDRLLCDLGPDTFAHALTYHLDLGAIGHALITHSHSDHFYPEDLVFRVQPYGHNDGRAPLMLYGNHKVGELLSRAAEIYDDTGHLKDFVSFNEVTPFQPFQAGNYSVIPLPVIHDASEDCFIYEITSMAEGKSLLYAHDTAMLTEAAFSFLQGQKLDAVSMDCTMAGAACGGSHMTLADCITVKKRLLAQATAGENTRFVISHFSHNGGMLHDELCAAAAPYGIQTAFDGFTLSV